MMNLKLLVSAAALSGLIGVSVVVGSALVHTASASAPVTLASKLTQAAQTTVTPTPGTKDPGTQQPGQGPKGNGRFGGGHRGHGGGPGFDRGFGGAYTADGANRVISATTQLLTLAQGDLAYANGKMGTTTVQTWLNSADNLIKSAQSAASSSQFGRAVETANAARGLIGAAEQLMRQALGANTLPSYTQRPGPGIGKGPGMGHRGGAFGDLGASGNITVTQAQASRVLAGLYNGIVAKDAQVKASSNSGDANSYLNAAKEYYRTAYDAYQAGKYNDAVKAASVGQTLLGVVESLLRAGVAPNNAETPVQVPAPNF